jgi:hypothetical protein
MARGKRRGRRHANPPILGDPDTISVGPMAFTGYLHRLVHHQRRHPDGRKPGHCGKPAPASPDRAIRSRTPRESWQSPTPLVEPCRPPQRGAGEEDNAYITI